MNTVQQIEMNLIYPGKKDAWLMSTVGAESPVGAINALRPVQIVKAVGEYLKSRLPVKVEYLMVDSYKIIYYNNL